MWCTPIAAITSEIDQHDRAEQLADPVRAVALDGEQADQDRERDPHDVRLERGADDAEPLDRRDHRDRRRQHRIGKEQGGREQRADQQPALRRGRARAAAGSARIARGCRLRP